MSSSGAPPSSGGVGGGLASGTALVAASNGLRSTPSQPAHDASPPSTKTTSEATAARAAPCRRPASVDEGARARIGSPISSGLRDLRVRRSTRCRTSWPPCPPRHRTRRRCSGVTPSRCSRPRARSTGRTTCSPPPQGRRGPKVLAHVFLLLLRADTPARNDDESIATTMRDPPRGSKRRTSFRRHTAEQCRASHSFSNRDRPPRGLDHLNHRSRSPSPWSRPPQPSIPIALPVVPTTPPSIASEGGVVRTT